MKKTTLSVFDTESVFIRNRCPVMKISVIGIGRIAVLGSGEDTTREIREIRTALLPKARVVKAFNAIPAQGLGSYHAG